MSLAGVRGCILPLLIKPCFYTDVMYPVFVFCNQVP